MVKATNNHVLLYMHLLHTHHQVQQMRELHVSDAP